MKQHEVAVSPRLCASEHCWLPAVASLCVAVQTATKILAIVSGRFALQRFVQKDSFGMPANPKQNHLLAALPEAEWKRWSPQMELIDLELGPCCTKVAPR